MTLISENSGDIPYLNKLTLASRGDEFPIGRPPYGIHGASITVIDEDLITISSNIPDLHSVILPSRGDAGAVRRPCHCTYGDRMPAKCGDWIEDEICKS